MKKILTIFGTRPEAIKMAPLVIKLAQQADIDSKVCVTGQHRHMLDQVLDLFDITPDFDLNIMQAGQDLYDVTSSILLKLKPILQDFKPDLILVHGDTSTTFAAALSAYYLQIPIGHVEAGLRTGNIYSPWPEAVTAGTVKLVGTHQATIVAEVSELLTNQDSYQRMSVAHNPYGDGQACQRIVDIIQQWFASKE